MKKYFNTEGNCIPQKHYMVKLDDRLRTIKEQYVDSGKYFVINRGRQYGKTTTLRLLAEYLKDDYGVVSLDFQKLDSDQFRDGETFARAFAELFLQKFYKAQLADAERLAEPIRHVLLQPEGPSLTELFRLLSELCGRASKLMVLLIDEVDSAANNQVFLDFLAQLRAYYIDREDSPTFHSVILAGVYDIKNLKLKIRPETEHQYNSPWNIAADYRIKMSFNQGQIAGMLREYEEECHTGMDVDAVAQGIYQYTSGYPYLVSAVCKILDEQLWEDEVFADSENAGKKWSREGIGEAVKILLKMKLPLFDSMVRQLDQYSELRDLIGQILYEGQRVSFNQAIKSVSLGFMFGYLKDRNGYIAVANRVFEMYLLNIFIAEESVRSDVFQQGQNDINQFIQSGRLDMKRVLEKFVEYFHEIYGDNDEKFIEKYGRKFFLLYLKPIINGTGNYYMEAQTRDGGRTDLVVDYRGEQFIVEMKIWRGNEYNERGERQLAEYLDYFHQKKGYMLSFSFNKGKEVGVKVITVGDREIVEAVV